MININTKKITKLEIMQKDSEVELNKDQQWNRVILLQISVSFFFLFNSIVFLVAVIITASHEIKVIHVLTTKSEKTIGFPTLHLAILSDEGYITDFTIEGFENNSFPKLPKTSFSSGVKEIG